ncbi:MAG TPA: TetR family transcriptional regulator [Pseudonocardiaceae bacterium]|nr:TetR family transcriptional regulator [Pseudonocardiaceae bacterium]
MTEETGRRERKKAQTRRSLADAALRLFLQHGYDQVSVKDVADAADVSVTTLFKHFPSKEALVFDEDDDIETALVAAVRDRAPGRSIPAALRAHILATTPDITVPGFAEFLRMTTDTPALRDYGHRMWMRHQTALAHAIAEEVGARPEDVACAALARFALETRDLTRREPDQAHALDEIFNLLEFGWTAGHPTVDRPQR